jgi:hypothetical protein
VAGNKRSGRKRKPTELKVLEGSFRKDRHGDPPAVVAGFPAAPEGLTPSQQALWDSFPRPGWIGQTDGLAVYGAVAIFDLILRNQQQQQATPESGHMLAFKVSYDGDGNERLEPKENPLIVQALKMWRELRASLAVLGLTPADRAKMTAPKVDGAVDDKWAGIL